jgi:hypothetical protein
MNDGGETKERDLRTNGANAEPTDGEAAERAIEHEIGHLRGELDGIVSELDRRRHEAFDVRLQLRRHRTAVAAAGAVALVIAVGGFVAWRNSRRRQGQLLVRLQNLGRAFAIMSRNPERLERALEGRAEPGRAALSALARVAGAAGRRAVLSA